MFMFAWSLSFSILVAIDQGELNTLQKIANDKGQKEDKRMEALLDIFRKHVHKEVDLESLSKTLGGATWVDESGVTRVGLVLGYVPIDFGLLGKFPVYRIVYGNARDYWLFFCIEKPLSLHELAQALKGDFLREDTKKIKILDCSFSHILKKINFKVLYHMVQEKK